MQNSLLSTQSADSIRFLSSRTGCMLLLVLGLGSCCNLAPCAHAQPASGTPKPAPPASLDHIQHLYVPEAQLSALFKSDDIRAVMSKSEFDALVMRARKAEKNAVFDQLPPVLSSAIFQSRIEGERLLADVQIRLTAPRKMGKVDLNVTGWNVLSVQLGDAAAAATRGGTDLNELQVFIPETGEQSLKLQVSAPLKAAGNDQLVSVGIPAVGAGFFRLTLPAGKLLRVNGTDPGRPRPVDQSADYELPIGGLKQIELKMTDGQTSSASDRLTFASTAYGVRVLPGETTWSARTELQIFGQAIDRLVCRVPQTLEITRVESEGLESWELAEEPDHPGQVTITLKYRQPVEGRRTISLQGILTEAAGQPWQVPDLIIAEVTAHTGIIQISHPINVRLQTLETQGVRSLPEAAPVQASAGAAGEQGLDHLTFAVWQEHFTLKFATTLKQQQVQAALTSLLIMNDPGVNLEMTASVQTRERPLFDIRVQIPVEYRILSVFRDGSAIDWEVVPTDAGISELRIPLNPPLVPGKSTTLILESQAVPEGWPVRETPVLISLPEVRLPQANMVEALYGITALDDFDLVPQELVGLDPAYQADLALLNTRLEQKGQRVRLGFTYQEASFKGQLQISRKPTLFTVETLTDFQVDRETVLTSLESRLAVSGGGIRELALQLSESAGENIRFQLTPNIPRSTIPSNPANPPVQIVEQRPGEVENGLRKWVLKFDRYLQGEARLTAEVRLPRGSDTQFSPVVITFPQANAQSGYLAIEGPPDQQIQVIAQNGDGSPLPTVDPVDLPSSNGRSLERIVAGYRIVSPGWKVSVTTVPFERSTIPSAIGHAANFSSVWNASGRLQHAAEYRFTAFGMQSLTVDLPESATLWSTMLDGQVIEARRMGQGIQIPLTGLAEKPVHLLQVVYETTTDNVTPESRKTTGELRAAPPRLSALSGDGALQPLTILEQQWDFYYPPDTILIDSTGEFRPENFVWSDTLIGRLLAARDTDSVSFENSVLILLGTILFIAVFVAIARFLILHGSQALTPLILIVLITLILFPLMLLPSVQNARRSSSKHGSNFAPEDEMKSAPDSMAITQPESPAVEDHFQSPIEKRLPDQSQTIPSVQLRERDEKNAAPPFSSSDQVFSGSQQGTPIGMPGPAYPVAKSAFATGGFLSVPVRLEIPDQSFLRTFHYRGNAEAANNLDLHVRYASRPAFLLLLMAVALGMALLGWWLRWAPRPLKFLYCLITLILPGVLVGLAPLSCAVFLPAVLAGGIATLIGWGLAHCRCLHIEKRAVAGGWRRRWSSASLLLAVSLVMTCGTTSRADDKPVAPATVTPAPSATPHVVIPYRKLSEISAADHVYVPAELFHRLWKAAHPEDLTPPDPSVPAVVAEGNIRGTLVADEGAHQARFQFRWVVVSFRDDPQTVPLPVKSSGLRNPKLNGEPASLVPLKAGEIGVLLPGRGVHVVDAELVVSDKVQLNDGKVSLETRPVPAGALTFEIPSKLEMLQLSATVSGQPLTGIQKELAGETTRFQMPVDRGGEWTLRWQTAEKPRTAENRLQLDAAILATIEDTGIQVNHAYDLKVRQGSLQEMLFSLPAELSLREVTGKDVTGWEIQSEKEGKRIRIRFGRAVSDQTQFRIDLYQPHQQLAMSEQFTVKTLIPQGIERMAGMLAVQVPDHLRVRTVEAKSLQQVDAGQFKPPLALSSSGPAPAPQLAYRFLTETGSLQLEVSRRETETRARAEYGVQIGRRKTLIASRILLNLTGAAQRLVEIRLPQGYLTMDVLCAEASDWYVVTEKDRQRLLIEFDQPRTGTIEIGLEGHLVRNPQDESLTIQLPYPVQSDRMTAQLGIWSDELYQPALVETGRWRSQQVPELAPEIRKLQPSPPLFALQTSEPVTPLKFQLRRAVPEIQSDAGVLIAVGEATVDYGLTLRWNIAHAAADRFALTVPSWLGHLDFTGPGIREIHSEPAGNDRTRWLISLLDPVRGQFLLSAAATIASPADRTIRTPFLEFEQMAETGEYKPLTVQRQFAAIVNLSQNQLSAADPAQFESIPADQLPLTMPPELVRQAMEIVRVRADKLPAWTMQRMERAGSAQAVIPSYTMKTVLQMDGSWRTTAVFGVRNRGQQFLALKLPDDSRILSVFVRGKPGRTVVTKLADQTIHLIALPQTSIADLSFEVTLMLAGNLPQRLSEWFSLVAQQIDLPSVRVVSPKESPEFGIAVAQTVWNVFVPDELHAVPVEKNGRTNLTFHRGSSGWITAQLQTVDRLRGDLAEMKRIVGSSTNFSPSQRAQARTNLQELQARLLAEQQISSQKDRMPQRDLSRRYGEELDQALSETTKALQDLEQAPDAQSNRLPDSPVQGLGNRAYISQNNAILMQANGQPSDSALSSSSKELSFNFFNPQDARRGRAAGKKASEEQAARGLLRQQLQSQSAAPPVSSNMKSDVPSQENLGMGFRLQPQASPSPGRPAQSGRPSPSSQPFGGMGGMGGGIGGGFGGRTNQSMSGNAASPPPVPFSPGNRPQEESGPFPSDPSSILPDVPQISLPVSGTTQGLSVTMELPQSGQELTFDKPGGDPVLTLAIRPRQTGNLLAGGVWALVWLLLGIWLLQRCFRNTSTQQRVLASCILVMMLGITMFLLLGFSIAGSVGFLAFLIAALTRGLLQLTT